MFINVMLTHLIVHFGLVNDEATKSLLLFLFPWVVLILLLFVLLGINVLAWWLLLFLSGLRVALATVSTLR